MMPKPYRDGVCDMLRHPEAKNPYQPWTANYQLYQSGKLDARLAALALDAGNDNVVNA